MEAKLTQHDERQKEAWAWNNRHRESGVNVSYRSESVMTDEKGEWLVSWPSIGAVSTDKARDFTNDVLEASALARFFNNQEASE